MTRWILTAAAAVGLGAFDATTASADHRDVERAQRRVNREWRDYQREVHKGHYRHAQREYRDVVRAQHRLNAEVARNGFGFGVVYGAAYCPPGSITTAGVYSDPYGYQQTYYYSHPYYYQQPAVAVGGDVIIWR